MCLETTGEGGVIIFLVHSNTVNKYGVVAGGAGETCLSTKGFFQVSNCLFHSYILYILPFTTINTTLLAFLSDTQDTDIVQCHEWIS